MKFNDIRYLASLSISGALAAVYIFFGIRDINPIILGDEYIYSYNSRNFQFFSPAPLGDYSNPFFELIFSSVAICGPDFYSCAKALNLFFLVVFLAIVLYILRLTIPLWMGLVLMVSIMVSPLQVYASMFLPESMMFASLAAVLAVFVWAQNQSKVWPWLTLGAAIALSASIKPHTLMFAVAIGIYMCFAKATAFTSLRGRALRIVSVVGSAVVVRLGLGLVLSGPGGVDFLGRYINASTVDKLGGAVATGAANTQGLRPIETATGQFFTHASSLSLAILAMTGLSLVFVLGSVMWMRGFRITDPSLNSVVFLVGIALFVYLIGVSFFSGWVSGTGDDHEFRVLMRYLDVMVPLVTIGGAAAAVYFARASREKANVFLRWTMAVAIIAVSTAAFTDFFASKEVQIADAPHLAGLITSYETLQWGGVAVAAAAIAWAAFPKTAPYGVLLLTVILSLFGGQAALSQYQLARGEDSRIERAGEHLRGLLETGEIDIEVIATSRFDATGTLFWGSGSSRIPYSILPPQTAAPSGLLSSNFVLSVGAIEPDQRYELIDNGQGFKVWQRRE